MAVSTRVLVDFSGPDHAPVVLRMQVVAEQARWLGVGHLDTPAFADDDSDDDGEDGDGEASCGAFMPHGAFMRNASRPGPAAVAWHGVLPDAGVRAALATDAAKVVEAARGQTFWVEADEAGAAPPRCALEQFALDVLRFHTRTGAGRPAGGAPVAGAEWWVQVRYSDGTPSIGLHWDEDEDFKGARGEHLPPWLATVTYLGDLGAPTIVLPVGADAHGRAVLPRAGGAPRTFGAFLSHPVAGKHLAFDGRLLHGALHDLAPPCEEAYVRVSLLVNVWIGHQPLDARRLPADVAASLAPAAGAGAGVTAFQDATLERPATAAAPKGHGPAAVDTDEEGWRTLRVGFVPRRSTCDACPGWRKLTTIGYPFFHPPIYARHMPTPPACAEARPSLVHAPAVEVSLHAPPGRGAKEDLVLGDDGIVRRVPRRDRS